MVQYLPILIVGFVFAIWLTPLSRRVAMWLGLVSQPRSQRLHHDPTPLLGGLAIYGAFVVALVIFGLPAHFVELGAIIAGATLMALLGLWDDRRELSPRAKFLGQAVASGVLVWSGVQVNLFGIPLLDCLFTIAWVLGVTNAINYQDNMDGLAAGIAAIGSSFYLIMAVLEGQQLVGSLAAALCGASVGFLTYNFNPANTFMGDMGSMVLGFALAVLGIKLRFAGPLNVTWMIPILVLGLPIFDVVLVSFTRIREGRSPLEGSSKDHTSHRLINTGLGQRGALLVLYAVCVVLGLAALLVSREPAAGWAVGALSLVVGLAAFVGLERLYRKQQHNG